MDLPPISEEVLNQPPPFGDLNLATPDTPLMENATAAGHGEAIAAFGAAWGTAARLELGRLANASPPLLHTHDAQGRRRDQVEFHPAYHTLMGESIAAGLHCSGWDVAGRADLVRRAAQLYLVTQAEAGHVCPLTMTHAAPAALAASPQLLRNWLPRIRSRRYDGRFLPFWEKAGVTIGMGMTEKQGGSDVRANITRATPVGGDEYEITGHKWFFSAPMSDAFLVLAQAPAGLTCLLMPRFRPDGAVNGLRLMRLKDKLGNRSNASAEVEFERAFAWRVGEEGRGVRTILRMVQLTRLDCAVSSAGLMRLALTLALHHARHRSAFQRPLVDQPAMAMVLADLALEAEAATALAMRLAASFEDEAANGGPRDGEAARARLLTPAIKFALCKTAPAFVFETMEVLGGNGYVEEGMMPRLYREAPVNAIWEGAGNMLALDLLRGAARDPHAVHTLLAELKAEAAGLPDVPAFADALERLIAGGACPEAHARRAAQDLSILAATAALARTAPPPVAEAYAATRLARPRGGYGTNAVAEACDLLLTRAGAA